MFPELLYEKYEILSDRDIYFHSPELMPKRYKTIKTYLKACTFYNKHLIRGLKITDTEKDEFYNLTDALIKILIIEMCLDSYEECKEFVFEIIQSAILENPTIAMIMVHRKFDIELVDQMVDKVPSFHLAFSTSFMVYLKHPDSEFYMKLSLALLKKYPLLNNIKQIMQISNKLNENFMSEIKEYIEAYQKNCFYLK